MNDTVCRLIFRYAISKEALIKSARAGSERFFVRQKNGKPGNTLCISGFSFCMDGEKDPLSSRRRFIQSFPNMLVMKGFLTPRGVREADFLFWGDFLPRFGGGKPGKGSGFLHTDITKGLSRNDK